MKNIDILKYNIKSLSHVKIRTWLTIIGIVIAVMAVVLLFGAGKGLNERINMELGKFGSNSVLIVPVNLEKKSMMSLETASGKLYEKDVQKLNKLPEIDKISKILYSMETIGYKSQNMTGMVLGVEPSLFQQVSSLLVMKKGRFLRNNDRKAVVLGYSTAYDNFDNEIGVGKYITINGEKYKVVGILEKTGNSMMDADSRVYATYDDVKKMLDGKIAKNEIHFIRLSIKKDYNMEKAVEKIKETLRLSHGVKKGDEDFSVVTMDSMMQQVGSISTIVNTFLLIISGISLVVGGIGVGNTMYMSVLERTKEIGVLRSIGATKKDIMKIFLFEAIMLTSVGGIIGILLSVIILFLISSIIPFSLNMFDILFAFVFSMLIGAITGYLPAKKAQEISPLEAVRYE